jgi:hypothetical protein
MSIRFMKYFRRTKYDARVVLYIIKVLILNLSLISQKDLSEQCL